MMRWLFVLVAVLGVLVMPAGAEEYWITYEGNDLPENEGWERHWGNDEGAHEGDGAIRTVENGILTMDSMYDLRVYDYACRYLYGEVDPDPGELFVAEWRVYVEDWVGYHGAPDSRVGVCSDDGWLLALGLFPDHVESQFEDDVNVPITPDVFHDYRLLSWDMHAYELYIDGALAHVGSFWEGTLPSKFFWGDGVSGAASLAHWDYVHFGVVPEPSALWLFVAGLTACVLRTVRGSNRQVVFLPVLACVLAASATAEPYWITYEGNDLPENEGWERMWGDEHPYEGDGAIRTVADGILTMDTRFDTGVYDYAYVERPGQTDPGPNELFVVEWRALIVEEVGGPTWDSSAWVTSDDGWQVVMGLRPHEVVSPCESLSIPIEPGVFHEYRLTSSDMRTYELYIDSELARAGDFCELLPGPTLMWGPGTDGVSSLSQWDYVRVGVVPEPASCFLCLLACAIRSRRR